MHKLYSCVNKNDYLNYLNLYFLQTFSFHSSVTCISGRPRLLNKLLMKIHKFVDIGNLKQIWKKYHIFWIIPSMFQNEHFRKNRYRYVRNEHFKKKSKIIYQIYISEKWNKIIQNVYFRDILYINTKCIFSKKFSKIKLLFLKFLKRYISCAQILKNSEMNFE